MSDRTYNRCETETVRELQTALSAQPRFTPGLQPSRESAASSIIRLLSRGGTALLVEDKEYARHNGRLALERFGFRVAAVGAGDDALELLESCGGRVDCAVIDLSLSGMDGAQLYSRVRQFSPRLPVLLASGEATRSILAGIRLDSFAAVISKPYRAEEIGERLAPMISLLRDSAAA